MSEELIERRAKYDELIDHIDNDEPCCFNDWEVNFVQALPTVMSKWSGKQEDKFDELYEKWYASN